MRDMMTVRELVEWLESQDQDLRVEVGMNQEYQNRLSVDECQVVVYEGRRYVLLGEPAMDWSE